MTTRSATIANGSAVDLTAALSLERGKQYLLTLQGGSVDYILISLGGDPNSLGGHPLNIGDPGRLIQQATDSWYARYLMPGSTTIVGTEARCA